MKNDRERLIKYLSIVNEYVLDKNLLESIGGYFLYLYYLEMYSGLTDTKLQNIFKELCKEILINEKTN